MADHLYEEMAHFSARAFMEDVNGRVRIRANLENRLQHTLTELWQTQSDLLRAPASVRFDVELQVVENNRSY